MQTVIDFVNGFLVLAGSLFSDLVSNWITSLFFVGCILVLVIDLVVSSSSGGDRK